MAAAAIWILSKVQCPRTAAVIGVDPSYSIKTEIYEHSCMLSIRGYQSSYRLVEIWVSKTHHTYLRNRLKHACERV